MNSKTRIPYLASALLAGCAAAVPMGDPKTDAALKEFNPPMGMVGVYIYRNENFGAAHKLDVLVDGLEIGSTGAKTYLYRAVAPGTHVITSKGENRESVEVSAKPGTLVFIWQEAKFGTVNLRSKLHVVNEAEGRLGVQQAQLAVP